MNTKRDENYYKGYLAGYKDGINNAIQGKYPQDTENKFYKLPIAVMQLSTRAYNCLSSVGCVYVGDVSSLKEETISRIRNLGTKTASEIAHWLDEHNICFSAWNKYL